MSEAFNGHTPLRGNDSAPMNVPESSTKKTGGRGAYKELARLIGSLDLDIKTPVRSKTDGSGDHEKDSVVNDVLDFSVIRFGMKVSLRGQFGRYLTAVPGAGGAAGMDGQGELDISTNSSSFVSSSARGAAGAPANASFGSISTIAGAGGGLGVQSLTGAAAQSAAGGTSGAVPGKPALSFSLGAEGQGVGEPLDCFTVVNPESKEDEGPIRYGQPLALRVAAAKERYLGVRTLKENEDLDAHAGGMGATSGALGFYRNAVGLGERWALAPMDGANAGGYVRSGDMLRIVTTSVSVHNRVQASAGGDYDWVLALQSTELIAGAGLGTRHEPRLLHQEALLGMGASASSVGAARMDADQLWQVEWFGTQPLPAWAARPFISGSYLTVPSASRSASVEAFRRCFPTASLSDIQTARSGANGVQGTDLHGRPQAAQEAVLVREVLMALSAVEGSFIRISADSAAAVPPTLGSPAKSSSVKSRRVRFTLDPGCADRGLVSQVGALLSTCEAAVRVRDFVRTQGRHEYGSISHALVGSVKTILREFDVLLAQLDGLYRTGQHGGLSMQKLTYFLQPARATLQTLDRLASRLTDLTGGRLLDELYAAALEQGDDHSRRLHLHLLEAAAAPFVSMLTKWLFRGDLDDAFGEFMIMEDTNLTREALREDFNAQYWEQRYKLREEHVPKIIGRLAPHALTAGKYLNVVRGCYKGDGALPLPEPHEFALHPDSLHTLTEAVNAAYRFSSTALLRLLEDEYGMRSHLKSLQRFFLLSNGDFFVQFMDTADEELRRDVADVALPRVQALLQLAVNTSTLATDPHREGLSCSLATHNLIQHLHLIQSAGESPLGFGTGIGRSTSLGAPMASSVAALLETSRGLKGIEAFTLDYNVGWPMSILLSRRSITKYQLLSRLLFFSKHIEARVLDCWRGHQSTKDLHVRGAMGPSFCLRHRMLHFLQNFVYYMTLEVINPRGHEMMTEIAAARDMDELLSCHERFLDMCLKECLLASQELLKILTKIMTTCLLFADQMTRFMESSSASNVTGSAVGAGSGGGKNLGKGVEWKLRQVRIHARSEHMNSEATHETYVRTIARFEKTFDAQVGEFLERLWNDSHRHHPQLSNLCVRLDYNGFYSGANAPPANLNNTRDVHLNDSNISTAK